MTTIVRISHDEKAPVWMLQSPSPKVEPRRFNNWEFEGWFGCAKITELRGWVENPRVEASVDQFKEEHAGRDPKNEEMLDIMIEAGVNLDVDADRDGEDDVDLKQNNKNKLLELAESIRLNGVRVPLIVVDSDDARGRRILDGNRRYFASLYLYRDAKETQDRQTMMQFETLPVWVLPSDASEEMQDHVMTELNSINDCYVKWPYSVRARRIYNDHRAGASIEQLRKKYHDFSQSRIMTVIKACKIAEEFVEHHFESVQARDVASKHLIWFDQLRRSNERAMMDDEFRHTIYDLVLDEETPFSSASDFTKLGAVYTNSEAWGTLTTGHGKEALRKALYILERDRQEGRKDARTKMQDVNNILAALVQTMNFDTVDEPSLTRFHNLVAYSLRC